MKTMPTKPSRQTISENVRKYRLQFGLTQEGLAARVSSALGKDYAHSRIAEIERGKYAVTSETIDRLADALDIPPSMLLVPVEELASVA
jgi:transcriptional regulator with XRE-family HTH domain